MSSSLPTIPGSERANMGSVGPPPHTPTISLRLLSWTMRTQSSHFVKVVCTPGVRGKPLRRSIFASSVTTRACSRRLSITSLSTLVGFGGSLGIGRLFDEDIFLPGFCLANDASVFFLSFSSERNCSYDSSSRR